MPRVTKQDMELETSTPARVRWEDTTHVFTASGEIIDLDDFDIYLETDDKRLHQISHRWITAIKIL